MRQESRTSQLGSDTCKCESHRNVRVLNLFACPFLVHVVQSVLQWGKDPSKKRREQQIQSDAKNESVAPEEKKITPRCKRRQTA